MTFLRSVPLLFFIVLLYNILAFGFGMNMSAAWLSFTLPSDAEAVLSGADIMATIGLFFLYFEIFKATRSTIASVLDHGLSMIVFIICLLEFILVPAMGSAGFFLITVMSFVDVVAGFTVSVSTARRDVRFGE